MMNMKAKRVIENIEFERGISPVRSLEIGRYADIYKKFKERQIDIDETIKMLTSLAQGIENTGGKWKTGKNLWKVINHYKKDLYHTDKVMFVYEMLYDIAFGGWKHLSEEEFMEQVYKYTQEVDYQPFTLIDTIRGIYHALQSDLEMFMESYDFKRGRDPKSAMGIGRYQKIKEFFSQDHEISIPDAIEMLIDLSWYYSHVRKNGKSHIRMHHTLADELRKYGKEATEFIDEILRDIVRNCNKLSEPEFIDIGEKWMEMTDEPAAEFYSIINGILYSLQMR